MSAKFRTLNVLLAGTMLASPAAFAQETAGNGEAEARQETVIVTGTPIRDSQLAAIEAKRNADNVVDIIAADTIGRFPDQNLADSLGRVPGLAIERDQGQARFINFRGAPFRYTKIAFDGVDVPGAQDGRIPRFDAFPSVVTSKIEVNKAITADMPGESTVGFINIETFKPFDREGWSFAGEAGYGQQQLGDVDIDKYNGRVSYSNDSFGFVAFASQNVRGRITDNREYEYADTSGDGNDDAVSSLTLQSYQGSREDNAYGGRIEFRPTSESAIFFSTLYSEFLDDEQRTRYDFDVGEVELGTETYRPVAVVTRVLEDGGYENSTFTNTLGYDGLVAGWEVEARLNYTETEDSTALFIPQSVGGVVGATVNVEDIFNPTLALTQPGQPGTDVDVNLLNYAATFGIIFGGGTDTEATKLMLSGAREFEFGGRPTELKFGGQYDTREAVGGSVLGFGLFPSSVDILQFTTGVPWYSDFENSIGGRNHDNKGLRAAWESAVGGFDLSFDEDSVTLIEEDVLALYAMGTTDFDWGNLVYGVRVEQTDFTSAGNLVNADGTVTPINAGNDFTNFLPSIHANFDLTDDLKLRLSASSGISRPTYSEIRASQSVDPIDLEVSGGNPFLDPEESFGIDASLEWYFAPGNILSVGAYTRRIDNVIYPGSSTVDGSIYAPGLIAPGTETQFNSFFNGEDGELTGFEVNVIGTAEDVLPAPFDGLGASGNITFLDSSFTAPTLDNQSFSLPGTSDTVLNASVFYEKFGVSARVNYQYRDAWLSTTENDSLSEFWDETSRVDASIRYTLPQDVYGLNITFALDGNNLTDEQDTRYINSPATPNQYEGFGRRWVASIRIDY
jgi:TonB-dependent receptor